MMKPVLTLIVALFVLSCPVAAQDADPKDPPAGEAKPEAKDGDELDAGLVADFNAFIKRECPDIDAGGKHDIYNLKDPTDKQERHDYTGAMSRLILLYMQQMKMGATLAKVFDQQSRGKLADSPTFKVLHAVVLLYYPPGKPNLTRSLELLREAADRAKDYAYPWFFLAQYELDKLRRDPAIGPREVFEALDKATTLQKDFIPAILLRCEVLLSARPPRMDEAAKLIAPYAANPPEVGDDFDSIILLQNTLLGTREFHEWADKLIASKSVSDRNKVRLLSRTANRHIADQQFDDAIADAEAGLSKAKAESDAEHAIQLNRLVASCWSAKAMDLQRRNPGLEGKLRTEFEQMMAAAGNHIRACAEIEAKWRPIALRGTEALQYVLFLASTMGDLDGAVQWLDAYLKGTDLVAAQRYTLENMHARLVATIEGTDDSLIDLYESFLAQDDLKQLETALKVAREQARTNVQRFKTARALTFFLGLLSNRERGIVATVAFLAADTALQMTEVDRMQASKAIADRHLAEIECLTEEQAELQAELGDAVKKLGIRADQARVARHQGTLIEGLGMTQYKIATKVAPVWSDEAFLKTLKDKPKQISSLELRTPAKAAAWLKSLADKLEADKPEETPGE